MSDTERSEQAADESLEDSGFSTWPAQEAGWCRGLFDADLEELRGLDRLGSLAFNDAPYQVDSIRRILRDLGSEDWELLPPLVTDGTLMEKLKELYAVINEMSALSAGDHDSAQRSSDLKKQLADLVEWFRGLAPLAVNARIDRRLREADGQQRDPADLADLRAEAEELSSRFRQLRHELVAQEEAVNQARATAGQSASEELSYVFRNRSEGYGDVARKWLIALCVAAPLVVGLAILTFLALRPDSGAEDPHDFAALGLGVFILGVLAFGLRVCAQNYRVNRHLEAVCRSKESSISTFQRLASSVSDEDIRSAVTLTLAQAIFAVDETGLIDGAGDHVTLVERAVLPNLPSNSSS